MTFKSTFYFLLFILLATTINAQEFNYGVKAGLNFSTIAGQKEEGESFKTITGFHIGAMINLPVTDRFGVSLELLYSQKGRKYRYEGNAFQSFMEDNGNDVFFTTGYRKTLINDVTNNIDIPITLYLKPTPNIRLGAGFYGSFVLNQKGAGESTYSQGNYLGAAVDSFTVSYEYNYLKDDAGFASGNLLNVNIGNNTATVDQVQGAYYNFSEKSGAFFNRFDLGAVFDVSYITDGGLEFGLRYQRGFLDLTNNFYDYSIREYDNNNEALKRNDKDFNNSFQVRIGFNF